MSSDSSHEEMPDKPTQKALRECAEAMVKMLEIGWRREDLDELERLWWTVRDNRGNVKGSFDEER